MSTLTEEVLSEREIEARHPDQWVLVDVLDWDAEYRVTRGVVRAKGDDRDVVHEAAMKLPKLAEPRKISIFYTGAWPQGQIYLLPHVIRL